MRDKAERDRLRIVIAGFDQYRLPTEDTVELINIADERDAFNEVMKSFVAVKEELIGALTERKRADLEGAWRDGWMQSDAIDNPYQGATVYANRKTKEVK